MKRCIRCDQEKPVDDFWRDNARRDGLHRYCKPCCNDVKRASYHRHVERNRERSRLRYAADPEPYKQRARAWQAANPERRRELWRQAAARRGQAERDRRRRWRMANREWVNAATRRRRALRLAAPSVDFDLPQLLLRLSMFPGCWVCGEPPDAVDHVKPLNKGGWHCLSNLRPICTSCNTRKRDIWPFSALKHLPERV